jgi:flagellar motor switch protein FliM
MSEFQVLSAEEVDELLKVTQDGSDLTQLVTQNQPHEAPARNVNAISNITELTRAAFEKAISSFFRKKVVVKSKSNQFQPIAACINPETDKSVYSSFHITPQDRYGMFAVDMKLLNHTINHLYGAKKDDSEQVLENPGKVGVIIAEKICQIGLSAFTEACKDYGSFSCEIIKSTPIMNLITTLSPEDQVYMMELSVIFDEVETVLKMMVGELFFSDLVPVKIGENKHREKDFWRTAIKSHVVDSYVNINVTLADVTLKVKDFMELKEGDVIPIADPTVAFVCLNYLKLFRATAGQANNKRVAKIISQI